MGTQTLDMHTIGEELTPQQWEIAPDFERDFCQYCMPGAQKTRSNSLEVPVSERLVRVTSLYSIAIQHKSIQSSFKRHNIPERRISPQPLFFLAVRFVEVVNCIP